MKNRNLVGWLLVVSLIAIALLGCSKKCDHTYTSSVTKEASCAEEGELTYTCSKCGNSYTEPIPKTDKHTYTSEITKEATVSDTGVLTYTCSICGHSYTETIEKIKSNWKIDYYVDEFGDKTTDSFAVGSFTGTFSNSATTGSDLTVLVYLDPSYPDYTQIRLLEYSSHKATFTSSDKLTLKTKDSSGNTKSYDMMYYSGDLYCTDGELRRAIENNEELSIVISEERKSGSIGSTYKFKIDNLGLAETLKEA